MCSVILLPKAVYLHIYHEPVKRTVLLHFVTPICAARGAYPRAV